MMNDELTCVVCQKPISSDQPSSQLTTKGCDGINKAGETRHRDICVIPGQHVHQNCRQVFPNPRYIEQSNHKRFDDIPSVPRVVKVTNEEIASVGQISICHFVPALKGHCPMQYDKLVEYDT